MRCYGRPAVRYRVVGRAVHNGLRIAEAVVQPHEALSVGIEAVYLCVYGIERVVIASFLVFGLMIDSAALYLDLTRVKVSLEIGGVVVSVPQAPFKEAEQLYFLEAACFIGYGYLLHLAVEVLRNKERYLCLYSLGFARYYGIAHTVTALIAVKSCLYG